MTSLEEKILKHNEEQREQKKDNKLVILLLILLIVGLNIGWSVLNLNLTINGTTTIKANTWDIAFESVKESIEKAEGSEANIPEDAKIEVSSDKTTSTITYNVNLNRPGDKYVLLTEAVNNGAISAILDSVTSTMTVTDGVNEIEPMVYSNYIRTTVEYSNDDGQTWEIMNQNDKLGTTFDVNRISNFEKYEINKLSENTKKVVKIRLTSEIPKDITVNDLPRTDITASVSHRISFVQK